MNKTLQNDGLLGNYETHKPDATLAWTAIIDVSTREDLGPGPHGHRFIVPILGGSFHAGPNYEGLSGVVLPGGADRQLLRSDGVKELDALYEMQIEHGPVITIHNKVVVDDTQSGVRYAMSTINASVQTGTFDWLNRRVLVGTLQSLRPERMAVVVRAWVMD
ncbi:MAG: DUF3237 domain-containing protein [Gammaproteobacteria bacterium]|nr:DUF3237 domain-containing protein [Gammaproteobacteria bacterium]